MTPIIGGSHIKVSTKIVAFFLLQIAITKELNDYKEFEMEVHEESRCYTR